MSKPFVVSTNNNKFIKLFMCSSLLVDFIDVDFHTATNTNLLFTMHKCK